MKRIPQRKCKVALIFLDLKAKFGFQSFNITGPEKKLFSQSTFRCFTEIIDKSQAHQDTEDEMEATRIDLAEKNMQIQSLQYDLYKLQEKYDKEISVLTKEVEWGREKVGSLKLEIRKLKEPEQEDTICMIR